MAARQLVHDWTPPALLRAARRIRSSGGRRNGQNTGGHAAATGTATKELGPEFYDATFEQQDRWKRPYWEMQWFGSWSVIADRIVTSAPGGASTASGGARVLDMGCGAGHLAALLRDRGVEQVVGFDFSEQRVAFAREHVPGVEFHVADAYTTELLAGDRFDVVVTTEFLEHVEGDLEILGRLRAGVRVLGTVPDYDSEGHVRFFPTRESVESRYAAALDGLRVDRLRNTTGTALWVIDGLTR